MSLDEKYINLFAKITSRAAISTIPYLALAPTIVTGAITLGFVQQIIRAFGRVETSLQYLVRSWPIIVELISVWKRLNEFENKLKYNTENISKEKI